MLRSIRLRLRAFFAPSRVRAELEDELYFHMEEQARVCFRNSNPPIAHRKEDHVLARFDLELDERARWRILHGIVQKIENGAAQVIGIAHHFDGLVGRSDHAQGIVW